MWGEDDGDWSDGIATQSGAMVERRAKLLITKAKQGKQAKCLPTLTYLCSKGLQEANGIIMWCYGRREPAVSCR